MNLFVWLCVVVAIAGTEVSLKSVYEQLDENMDEEINSLVLDDKNVLHFEDTINKLKMEENELQELIERMHTSDVKESDSTEADEGSVNQREHYKGPEMLIAGNNQSTIDKRGVGINLQFWPKDKNGKLHIPYIIDSSLSNNAPLIERYIAEMNSVIRCNSNVWRPRTTEKYYVKIIARGGCYSYLGKVSILSMQPQPLSLTSRCLRSRGIVHHEMMHAMGFFHEQSRSDRDKYVKIHYKNIRDGTAKENFKKAQTNNMNTPYDYGSVMHYGKRFFIRANAPYGAVTIETLDKKWQDKIGQRKQMSELDITEINRAYSCPEKPTTAAKPKTTESKTTTPKPETMTSKPETTTTEPETTTPEPETTNPGPETTTSEPETTTPEPKTTTSEPETTTARLEVTTQTPVLETNTLANCTDWSKSSCIIRGFEVVNNQLSKANDPWHRWNMAWRFHKGKQTECKDKRTWCHRLVNYCHYGFMKRVCKKTCNFCEPQSTTPAPVPPTVSLSPFDASYLKLKGLNNNNMNSNRKVGEVTLKMTRKDVQSHLTCHCHRSKWNIHQGCDQQKYCLSAIYRVRSPYSKAASTLNLCINQDGLKWGERCTSFGGHLKHHLEVNKWKKISHEVNHGYCDKLSAFVKVQGKSPEEVQISQFTLVADECKHDDGAGKEDVEDKEEGRGDWDKMEVPKNDQLDELTNKLDQIEDDVVHLKFDLMEKEKDMEDKPFP